jgi:hypothetical protein
MKWHKIEVSGKDVWVKMHNSHFVGIVVKITGHYLIYITMSPPRLNRPPIGCYDSLLTAKRMTTKAMNEMIARTKEIRAYHRRSKP